MKGSNAFTSVIETIFKPKIIWSTLLILVLIFSIICAAFSNDRVPFVIYFPAAKLNSTQAVSELRFLPRVGDKELAIQRLIEDMLLGPMNAEAKKLALPAANLNTILLRDNVVYVDLSTNVLFDKEDLSGLVHFSTVSADSIVFYIEKTLKKNYPKLKPVITIGGQLVENSSSLN